MVFNGRARGTALQPLANPCKTASEGVNIIFAIKALRATAARHQDAKLQNELQIEWGQIRSNLPQALLLGEAQRLIATISMVLEIALKLTACQEQHALCKNASAVAGERVSHASLHQ